MTDQPTAAAQPEPVTARDIDVVFAHATATFAHPAGGGVIRVQVGSHWWRGSRVVREHPELFTDDPRWGLFFLPEEQDECPGFDAPRLPTLAGQVPGQDAGPGDVPVAAHPARGHRHKVGAGAGRG